VLGPDDTIPTAKRIQNEGERNRQIMSKHVTRDEITNLTIEEQNKKKIVNSSIPKAKICHYITLSGKKVTGICIFHPLQ
jgi:hypothetical protein